MNVKLDKNNNAINTGLKIFYITIILICIISVIVAICIQTNEDKEQDPSVLPQSEETLKKEAKEKFTDIFKNKVNYMENNSYKITKSASDKEIVYTGYSVQENKVSDYEIDVHVPYINIVSDTANKFNEEIKNTFENKTKSVLNTKNNAIIYNVNYSAYVTNNILSIVVRSILREGDNPQRDIIQTYNYDLVNDKEYTMENFLELKGLSKQQVNQKIRGEIKLVQENVSQMKALGYNVYERDPDSEIYSINNVTEYFIGKIITYILYLHMEIKITQMKWI